MNITCMDVYFATLQLDVRKKDTYTCKDIRRAFKKLALKWHPDRNTHNMECATEKMKNVNEAYAYLIKAVEKKENVAKPVVKPVVKPVAKPVVKPVVDESKKCREKDALFETECAYWKTKIVKFVNQQDVQYILTSKIVYVDLFRTDMEEIHQITIPSHIIEKIGHIWYNYPVQKSGTTKYIQSFYNHYITQHIHGAPESTFYSKGCIHTYLKQRAQSYASSHKQLLGIERQELSIIMYLLQTVIWD